MSLGKAIAERFREEKVPCKTCELTIAFGSISDVVDNLNVDYANRSFAGHTYNSDFLPKRSFPFQCLSSLFWQIHSGGGFLGSMLR